jgi:hypothetical protein
LLHEAAPEGAEVVRRINGVIDIMTTIEVNKRLPMQSPFEDDTPEARRDINSSPKSCNQNAITDSFRESDQH